MTPDLRVSPYTGYSRPKVLLSRLTLRASSGDRANVAGFSFCVDQAFTRSWRAGDVLHVARTGCAGLGVSVLRGSRLIAAIGAVTAVPHGALVNVRFPRDAIREAEGVFRGLDAGFRFAELPIEVQIESERRVLYRGRPRICRSLGVRSVVKHVVFHYRSRSDLKRPRLDRKCSEKPDRV